MARYALQNTTTGALRWVESLTEARRLFYASLQALKPGEAPRMLLKEHPDASLPVEAPPAPVDAAPARRRGGRA